MTLSLYSKTLQLHTPIAIELEPYYEYSILKKKDDLPQDTKNQKWITKFNELLNTDIKSAFWIKISIKNSNSKNLNLFLLSERSFIYSIDCYVTKNQQVLQHYHDSYHKESNITIFKGVTQRVFPLNIPKNEQRDIYFKVQSFEKVNALFTLHTASSLATYTTKYNLLQGIFFGVMMIMIIYNLILYFMLKFKPYLYYVLYVGNFILFESAYLGYLHEYTPLPSLYIYISINISIALFLIFVTLFLKKVFDFKKNFFKLNQFISWIGTYILISHFFAIVALYNDNFQYAELCTTLFYLAVPILYLSVFYGLFFTAYRNYNKLAYYYAFIWLVLGFIGLLQSLSNNNLIPFNNIFDYIFEFGMLIEAVVFSLLVGHHIREIIKEKEENKRLLIHQNKLASMGEMISLIAHQWRQPLSEINGIVLSIDIDHKKGRLDQKHLNRYLNNIEEVTAHLSKTMSDFILLSSPKKELEQFKLLEVIKQSKKLANSSIVSTFELNYDSALTLLNPIIYGYKSELIQVFLILFKNSIDACSERNIQARIIIRATLENQYIVLEVEDNGGGVKKNILENIYNPYFTTKHKAQGTGLGLYILKMIIETSMQGEVHIKNGKYGAIFILKIPLSLA